MSERGFKEAKPHIEDIKRHIWILAGARQPAINILFLIFLISPVISSLFYIERFQYMERW
ncbi:MULTISPECIES: hypothetical protein [Methanobacterium]|jgi:hypothetical protein|uniref:Uncharacterized protein n=1 Tax=Methanobacterium bryantii TaxID=2161 RepID=A0A2A2H180_METBR|nr:MULTISPECIES: hypothetical protein [Methanobacterium]OEC86615.1 hypothetical protein A9507_10445 [Methanobacterium sp. A39]PAV03137.1 hypothetical protein ASJ80_07660 [Methanobacterium bryantii]